jgi:hypothetical protein
MPGKCGMTQERLLELHKITNTTLEGDICKARIRDNEGNAVTCDCFFAEHSSSGK